MTEPLLPRHREKVLHARAISDEVIDSWPQRYQSFEAGDWETFIRLMRWDTSKWKPRTLGSYKGKVTQTGGVVITRHAINEGLVVNEGNEPAPYARLDLEVWMGKGESTHYLRSPDEPDTKRLDMHPKQPARRISLLGRGNSADAFEPVDAYFCLEGCLKADAVLSAGCTSFSSTSVTTWKGSDLQKLLPKLRQVGTVYVVPDSDYMASDKFNVDGEVYFNPSVMYQTKMAAQWLVERRVNAKIAIPWAAEAESGAKLGVDDYLALGYSVKDLRIEEAFADQDPIRRALRLTRSEERILADLMHGFGERGAFRPKKLAKKLKLSRDTILSAYKRFEALGIMRVWEGWAHQAADGRYYNDPHWYVAYRLLNSYGNWLRAQPIPSRVTRVMLESSLGSLPAGQRV